MDRDYRNPQDVAGASQERVEESLVREVRRGVRDRPFVLRRRFEYEGGRVAPLLWIGTISRAWTDYMNANARATDMISGTCTSGPGVGGGTVLHLTVTRGRGASDGNLLELNRVFRRVNIELVYADPDADGEESEQEAAAGASDASEPDAAVDAPSDPAAEAKAIRDAFEAFKAAPTAEGLDDLNARIAAWRTGAADADDSQAGAFIEKLAALLAEKGEALVAKAGS